MSRKAPPRVGQRKCLSREIVGRNLTLRFVARTRSTGQPLHRNAEPLGNALQPMTSGECKPFEVFACGRQAFRPGLSAQRFYFHGNSRPTRGVCAMTGDCHCINKSRGKIKMRKLGWHCEVLFNSSGVLYYTNKVHEDINNANRRYNTLQLI